MKDYKSSVKKVMVVFLCLFVALISYIAYFQTFKATKIADDEGNKRKWAQRNEILRGTIYDRDMNALTQGEKTGVLTQSRTYPYNDLYVHAVGYINQTYGLSGLEDSYDNDLTTYSKVGSGFRSFFKDFDFKKLKESFLDRDKVEKKEGNSIVTTLDTHIQQAAYDALGDNVGAVVALNPKTGEVLAMVSKPTYNPNDLKTAFESANNGTDTQGAFINRTISGLYPPGSTFKTITTASALKNLPGIEDETFNDNGALVIGDYTLHNAGGGSNGPIQLKQAFAASSNYVYGTLGLRLGNDNLKATAEDFGFNNTIPSEGFKIAKSKFPTLKSYEKGMIAQSGIGQSSIAATPMQMALVASTIANGGVMMEPKLVNKVIDLNGNEVRTIGNKEYKQVIDEFTASTIKDYMINLVNSNGSMYYFNGYNVAGKTGTADHSEAADAKAHSWFIGFAPADDPQIAVAVIVENGGWGSQVAAPIAGSVVQAALNK